MVGVIISVLICGGLGLSLIQHLTPAAYHCAIGILRMLYAWGFSITTVKKGSVFPTILVIYIRQISVLLDRCLHRHMFWANQRIKTY